VIEVSYQLRNTTLISSLLFGLYHLSYQLRRALYRERQAWESAMTGPKCAGTIMALMGTAVWAQGSMTLEKQVLQVPDQDGAYYAGPEVTAPRMVSTVQALYASERSNRDVQGMTVLAMLIDVKGAPQHIQVLHTHGDAFDQSAIAAVRHSTFEPGQLGDKPVPVWIDVRVVFHADHSNAIPQVLITERDLAPPEESKLEDKHHKPLSYTPPFPIHTVDADFADPFAKHPYVQVAVVTVLVSETGMPKEVRVSRGLGFGLDEKAAAAVWHYRFLPATSKGKPVAARRDVMVSFTKF
jgi:TonB family protein